MNSWVKKGGGRIEQNHAVYSCAKRVYLKCWEREVKSKNAKIWIWLEFALKIGDRSTVIFKNLSCDCNYLDTKVILGSLESWNLIVAKIFWRCLEDLYFLEKWEDLYFQRKNLCTKLKIFAQLNCVQNALQTGVRSLHILSKNFQLTTSTILSCWFSGNQTYL